MLRLCGKQAEPDGADLLEDISPLAFDSVAAVGDERLDGPLLQQVCVGFYA